MGARMNLFAEELPQRPVTLPALKAERRELAARLAERRTIRVGLDAWRLIHKAESFESWQAIGAALAVGKAYALRVTGANRAWGRYYTHCFSKWMREHGFGTMPKSVRSVAIESA